MSDIDNIELTKFKEVLKKYLDIDDAIKRMTKNIREKKSEKKKITEYILEFMGKYNIEDLSVKNSKLKRSVSYTKKPLNNETIKTLLSKYYNNNVEGDKIAKYLLDNRSKSERVRLKRLIKK